MTQSWVRLSVWSVVLVCFCVGLTSGCAVFRATGRSVKAVGKGVGHAVVGTGRAIGQAARETKRELSDR
ncbi:MAG: hypothetical protein HOP18_09545 [Deltaproteobacteria bacterium]|nr:hypothetical protein [Deltaproteobacteria bacterium]